MIFYSCRKTGDAEMAKERKPKFRARRRFDRTAFSSKPRILDCEGHGYINVTGLEKSFPDKTERLAFINALIDKMKE
jgi:hypothetical protein